MANEDSDQGNTVSVIIGTLKEFNKDNDDWILYTERMEHFFGANNIKDAQRKQSLFLSSIGAECYKLLSNLLSPEKPASKSYSELVSVLKNHYQPKPSEIVERCKFNSRQRKPNESVSVFISELRSLAENCNFGTTLNEMLRDRLVCGINDDSIQKRLLSEDPLSFEKAMKIAISLELASKNVSDLQGMNLADKAETDKVHQLQRKKKAPKQKPCYRCGKNNHRQENCYFKESKCKNCGKIGHINKACKARSGQNPKSNGSKSPKPSFRPRNSVQHLANESDEDNSGYLFTINHTTRQIPKSLKIDLCVNDVAETFEIDTGASISLISEDTYLKKFSKLGLNKTNTRLSTYTGEKLDVKGLINADIAYEGQKVHLPLYVVASKGPSLIGRDLLEVLKVNWNKVFPRVNTINSLTLKEILKNHGGVFQSGLGTLKDIKAAIHIDESVSPTYCKARTVPYAMRQKVEHELQRLEEDKIIEPIQYSEWAAPIVPVLKPDKSVRICGDYKLTVNKAAKTDKYPIPKAEDIFATLAGGEKFSKLDLTHAYQQVHLDDKSKEYVVINTHKGLYRYNRLPFGVSSAPGIFQRIMENLLQGIPHVAVYLDDVLITGSNDDEHLKTLNLVLSKLESAGLRLKRDKCEFMAPSVIYLGHKIDKYGLHPTEEKVRAIHNAPEPTNVSELKSFLGLLTYYSKFLRNLTETLAPLYALLQKGVPFKWGSKERRAFEKSKSLLTSSKVLVHFNPKLDLILACDASNYGIGAVLAHRMADGSEKPIAFASRTMNKAEQNYSQVEKEGLACIFGVKKFHSYLYGRHFELITDNKAIHSLFNEKKAVSPQASSRIQRWSLTLGAYDYTLKFRNTQNHANADALSRLPLAEAPANTKAPVETVLMMEMLNEGPIKPDQIRKWTRTDPVLSKVLTYTQYGWPEKTKTEDVKPYLQKQNEITTEEGCLMWGNRVIMPKQGRKQILDELHQGHPGMARMKSLARMIVWWPNIDSHIEEKIKHCNSCQEHKAMPPKAPLHPWQYPDAPWERVHVDYAGPFMGHMFLVVVDAYSKWIEVHKMTTSTSSATIQNLRKTFSQFGIPDVLVTDNGTCFTSEEFKIFCEQNGIRHVTSAPFHPASNGLAERAVQTVKQGLKKMTAGTIDDKLSRFLFQYRLTPQTTTGETPAKKFLNRELKSRLDKIRPDLKKRVQEKQWKQKMTHDKTAVERKFEIGQTVYVKNYGKGQNWLPGTISQQTGPVSFAVSVGTKMIRRHQDQIRARENTITGTETRRLNFGPNEWPNLDESEKLPLGDPPVTRKTYPSRERRAPDRYGFS